MDLGVDWIQRNEPGWGGREKQGGKDAGKQGSREKPVPVDAAGLAADAVLDYGVYWGEDAEVSVNGAD